ncbi:hypothetical protein E4T42_07514 [Aureobasidium subglaciale]|uniref:Uncharacterized protein n=1 Tax=Aureobasidium subglaciale (strain EXF-2481) TaxID=1043005 RepID=A0A074YFV9_AURSE|nr:uncharacterized protein AUEXF2481DRAFT_5205 [Aureobasidium subglaciale EXF-2481]KAI5211691.1 hypothetical protein E4T38_01116 [Aureobasidium subglaciale]KAI5230378.1 hypothetical protein E4T40_01117 [Aureobasidium subglaciale]KAI5233592.1 hypothetical protein E4T41_01115 [Aureobasidium subglaciale]KAI5243066.1 hypothetical protein E4T42_07514 [Aureobasidium subglaciale]KAI5266846.1 hypothetical protein E4T46_01115 [Aureobasidium subglaciale]
MFATLFLLAAPFAFGQSDIPLSQPIQGVLATSNSSLYTYPTDFTQGILPKAIHSHNDYWRPKPFYTALSNGVISVEADVWLYNGTLYVGHEQSALTHARTFDSLYIQPILSVLKKQNPTSPFVTGSTHNGVFDTDAGQTLYLWVDVKTDGPTAWPYVVSALEPLRQGGWLTKYNGTGITNGAVTVIGTGNTPRAQVEDQSQRDYFFDGPLSTLNATANSNITRFLSPIASTSFKASFGWPMNGQLNDTALAKLRGQIASASARGIGTRYWETPNWPVSTRNAIWHLLWNEGATLINADDLPGAANFWQ